jgi:hypothetical protein
MAACLETRIMRAARRLVKAEVNYSWRGGGAPADIPVIERELALARKRFKEAVDSISSVVRDAKESTF